MEPDEQTDEPGPGASAHDDSQALTAVLADLRDEVRGLRSDVRAERRGRRITLSVGAIMVLLAFTLGAGWIADLRAEQRRNANAEAQAEAEACRQRTESRDEVRQMGVALTAYAVDVAGITDPAERARIIQGAELIAYATLPPPDC